MIASPLLIQFLLQFGDSTVPNQLQIARLQHRTIQVERLHHRQKILLIQTQIKLVTINITNRVRIVSRHSRQRFIAIFARHGLAFTAAATVHINVRHLAIKITATSIAITVLVLIVQLLLIILVLFDFGVLFQSNITQRQHSAAFREFSALSRRLQRALTFRIGIHNNIVMFLTMTRQQHQWQVRSIVVFALIKRHVQFALILVILKHLHANIKVLRQRSNIDVITPLIFCLFLFHAHFKIGNKILKKIHIVSHIFATPIAHRHMLGRIAKYLHSKTSIQTIAIGIDHHQFAVRFVHFSQEIRHLLFDVLLFLRLWQVCAQLLQSRLVLHAMNLLVVFRGPPIKMHHNPIVLFIGHSRGYPLRRLRILHLQPVANAVLIRDLFILVARKSLLANTSERLHFVNLRHVAAIATHHHLLLLLLLLLLW
mmetsp:Transcript_32237/g.52163  ORF Transcript_32237/g.52163 Transcript_32237/m.52163 type:complete len:426 (-) Transcript_32237:6-1283(-)